MQREVFSRLGEAAREHELGDEWGTAIEALRGLSRKAAQSGVLLVTQVGASRDGVRGGQPKALLAMVFAVVPVLSCCHVSVWRLQY